MAAIVTVWGLASLFPLGVWLGITPMSAYSTQWGLWWWTFVVTLLTTIAALALTRGRVVGGILRLLEWAARLSCPRYLTVLGLTACMEAAATSVLCFARNPQLIDTWAQYFQARIFLSGVLAAPPPPSLVHFGILQMPITEHGWFSQYPPIHPALLALGMAVGAPWLVTPVLAAALPATVYFLGRRTGDERVARVAAGLTVLSPFIIAMSASAMNHLPAALCVAAGLWTLPDVGRGRVWAAGLLGLITAILAGIRPLDAVTLAVVGGCFVLAAAGRRVWSVPIVTASVGVTALLPVLAFNAATTGDPFTFGYLALYGESHALGFHAVPWGEALTPLRAVGLTAADAHELNVYLLEWPLPITAIITVGLWLRRGRLDQGLRAATGYLLTLTALLFFYFHRDWLYGPRFLFSAVPAVLVLLASALVRLGEIRRPIGWRQLTGGNLAVTGIAVMTTLGAVLLAPQRLASYRVTNAVLAHHPDADARRAGLKHAVVVMRDGWGTRLIVRMWEAGVPVAASAGIYRAFDACALEERLRRARATGVEGEALVRELTATAATANPGRTRSGLTHDPLLRLPADGRLMPACARALAWDQEGTMQFAAFLYLNAPTLDGEIVWAREMPETDTLRHLYPDRPIYRYSIPDPAGAPGFTQLFPPLRKGD